MYLFVGEYIMAVICSPILKKKRDKSEMLQKYHVGTSKKDKCPINYSKFAYYFMQTIKTVKTSLIADTQNNLYIEKQIFPEDK